MEWGICMSPYDVIIRRSTTASRDSLLFIGLARFGDICGLCL